MIYLFFFILWCCLVGWVYGDAWERKSSCPWLWGILTFFFVFFILPIFLLVRPPKPQKKNPPARPIHNVMLCPHCGKYYQSPAKFCPNCGTNINNKER